MTAQNKIQDHLDAALGPNSRIIRYLVESDFYVAPASTRFHGVREGGLAAHSLGVLEQYRNLLQDCAIDLPERSIVVCTLLHDVCKIGLYSKKPRGGYLKSKNHPGGHARLSIERIKKYVELSDLEEKIIRYHMSYYYTVELNPSVGEYTIHELVKAQNDPAVLLLYFADHITTVGEKTQIKNVNEIRGSRNDDKKR